MTPSNQRRRRQLDQLVDLCRRGAVSRAIDLAYEHFACFGQDEEILVLLEASVERSGASDDLRRRFLGLRALPS
jgi:hypothetical protein